jgi:hypothetical protein
MLSRVKIFARRIANSFPRGRNLTRNRLKKGQSNPVRASAGPFTTSNCRIVFLSPAHRAFGCLIRLPGAHPAVEPAHTPDAMLVPNQELTVFAPGPKIAVGKKTAAEHRPDENSYRVALPQLNAVMLQGR